jgi:hypothetical protein
VITIKVLKRKDAASVLVAVVLAMVLVTFLNTATADLAGKVAMLEDGQFGYAFPGSGWKAQYLHPFAWMVLQVLLLELILWLVVLVRPVFVRKGK